MNASVKTYIFLGKLPFASANQALYSLPLVSEIREIFSVNSYTYAGGPCDNELRGVFRVAETGGLCFTFLDFLAV